MSYGQSFIEYNPIEGIPTTPFARGLLIPGLPGSSSEGIVFKTAEEIEALCDQSLRLRVIDKKQKIQDLKKKLQSDTLDEETCYQYIAGIIILYQELIYDIYIPYMKQTIQKSITTEERAPYLPIGHEDSGREMQQQYEEFISECKKTKCNISRIQRAMREMRGKRVVLLMKEIMDKKKQFNETDTDENDMNHKAAEILALYQMINQLFHIEYSNETTGSSPNMTECILGGSNWFVVSASYEQFKKHLEKAGFDMGNLERIAQSIKADRDTPEHI